MTAEAPQQPQRRWRLGLRKRVPEVRQMTMTDCGAACLAMVLAYHGRHMGLDAVREVTGPGRDGASAKALKAAAQKLGLRVRAISVDLDRLPFLPPATILHWRFTHYVVFERLGRGWVEVVDPDQGRRRVSMEQFSQCFTGVALLLEPSENFQPGHTRRGPYRYLVPLVKRQAGTLVKVLALSAVLQVLTLAVPLLTGMVVDRVVPRQDYSLMGVLSAALAGVLLFELLTSVVRGQLLVELRTRLDSQMTQGLLDHLVSLAYPFFQLRPAGDLLTRLGSQQAIRELLSTGLLSSALDGALVLLYLGLLLVADASLGLLVVGLGLLQVLVFALPRARQRSHLSRSLDMGVRSQSYLMAMLSGMQTLKAFGVEDRMVGSYSNLYVDLLNVELERGRLSAWLDALTGTLRRVSPLVLLCVGAWRVLDGAMSLGQMLSINALATALLVPLSNLLGTGGQLQFLSTYLERINDVLDTPPRTRRGAPGPRAHAARRHHPGGRALPLQPPLRLGGARRVGQRGAGADGGARRPFGRGQEHPGAPAAGALPAHLRTRPVRRRGAGRTGPARGAQPTGRGVAGCLVLQRVAAGEHHPERPGAGHGPCRGGREAGPHPRRHHGHAHAVRHAADGPGPLHVRWPAAETGPGARPGAQARHPPAR